MIAVGALVLAGCSSGGASNVPAASATAPAPGKPGAVVAGAQIGTLPTVPAGWMPPARITPANPLPGMFQSVGDTPAQPAAKVRVFFLGMQW
jgi:hypothetical protein